MAEITEDLACRVFHGMTRGIIWPCQCMVNKSSFIKEINTFSLNYASCQGSDIIANPGISILLSWQLKWSSCFARLFRNLRSKPQNLNIITLMFCWVFTVPSPDNISTGSLHCALPRYMSLGLDANRVFLSALWGLDKPHVRLKRRVQDLGNERELSRSISLGDREHTGSRKLC